MTRMRAIVVSLTTDPEDDSKTAEQLYVGLWGKRGGREFPLRSREFDEEGNFAAGTTRVFLLGWLPGSAKPPEGRQSDRTDPGQANDPALLPFELDGVEYVYLRKQATGTESDDDDAYRLTRIKVDLFGTGPSGTSTSSPSAHVTANTPEKRFELDTPGLWFGNEHGHQAWLKEVRIEQPPG
jgi:hypothetical protein